MDARFTTERDPADWCGVWAVFFLALVWWRLGSPGRIYFDEVHYVPAARKMLLGLRANPEHPLFAKELIAASIHFLGDKPLAWRIPSALCGGLGLFAFSRVTWFASGSRAATFAALLLVASDFAWFVQSRIAMLDMVMAMLGMVGLWLCLGAVRLPDRARWRLIGAGLAFGLALGAKWSVAPVIVLPGLTLLVVRLRTHGARFLTASDRALLPGISLIEAALWLGILPLCVYWLTFWPGFFWTKDPINPLDPLGWHRFMLRLQDSVTRLHPYRSRWYQWMANWRAIWYLYEPIDGAQRGVLLVGNPLTMLAGLPALGWALWAGIWRRRYDALMFALLYLASLMIWAVNGKPIQFYYHYLLPGTFLMACLALALVELWQLTSRWRWLAPGVLAGSVALFVFFYPILSALPLTHGKASFERWVWLDSWR